MGCSILIAWTVQVALEFENNILIYRVVRFN